jgi:hypothetical protein
MLNCSTQVIIFMKLLVHQILFCVPYTSPALIAKELGVPVCYFSTASDFELLDFIDEIPVHKSVESLKSHIELVLRDHSRTRSKNL